MVQPILEDQYNAARAYFVSVVGLLFVESLIKLPSYLQTVVLRRRRPFVKNSSTHSKPFILFHKLLTLPSFIPFVTHHNFPDLLRLTGFIGLNLLFGIQSNRFSGDYNLYGWLTIANGGLALLMGARNNLFAVAARVPSSTLLLYHRWAGRATVIHATIHFSLNVQRWIRTKQVATVLENRRIQVGIMAWIALCVILITSVGIVRRKWFEAFYYPHALFLVFVVGAMVHASHGPEFLLPGLILWALDRLIRFCHNFRRVRVISAVHYPGGLTKIRFEGLKTTHPGQIAWVQLPGVSFFNWHPFTIASAPGDKEAVIAIRGLGGYTKRLFDLASGGKYAGSKNDSDEVSGMGQLMMRADGPYNVGHINWGIHPVTVLVAGGVGITPGVSIATHIIERAATLGPYTHGQKQWHVHLLWIVKDGSHIQWFDEELKHLGSLASNPSVPATLEVTIHVTGGGVSAPAVNGEKVYRHDGPGVVLPGRPDLQQWFRDISISRPGLDAAVNACGPRALIDGVRKAAAKASCAEGIFQVEEEVFEL